MRWSSEAEEAIKKVPFFVRKKVRARVENEARKRDRTAITLADLQATQKRYLTNMASEVKGYQLDTCFGPSGCPNSIAPDTGLSNKIEAIPKTENFPLTKIRTIFEDSLGNIWFGSVEEGLGVISSGKYTFHYCCHHL